MPQMGPTLTGWGPPAAEAALGKSSGGKWMAEGRTRTGIAPGEAPAGDSMSPLQVI